MINNHFISILRDVSSLMEISLLHFWLRVLIVKRISKDIFLRLQKYDTIVVGYLLSEIVCHCVKVHLKTVTKISSIHLHVHSLLLLIFFLKVVLTFICDYIAISCFYYHRNTMPWLDILIKVWASLRTILLKRQRCRKLIQSWTWITFIYWCAVLFLY